MTSSPERHGVPGIPREGLDVALSLLLHPSSISHAPPHTHTHMHPGGQGQVAGCLLAAVLELQGEMAEVQGALPHPSLTVGSPTSHRAVVELDQRLQN